MFAYQYLALYHYNQSDKDKAMMYVDKIEAIEPGNGLAKQISDALKGGGAKPAPKKPAK